MFWDPGASTRTAGPASRGGPLDDHDDVDAAVGLARLVHDALERFGTGGGVELDEQEIRVALIVLNAAIRRFGITTFELPLPRLRNL
ncbi:hypothetical protein [Amycolatopsis orientalis]|uniref:hypothetical protein n=1 Tax=Amycolatopsis orientalis TaxID=31958 RepID=UPI000565EE08|nr:hypothetical protein [Amycolatopsis orientalis]